MNLTKKNITAFRADVYRYYHDNSRDLPWRNTTDPYHIYISEIMLQQTQVSRIIVKYIQFIERFPDINTLAEASLKDILEIWQGLGYNRRALSLHKAASLIVEEHNSLIPQTLDELMQLPRIGHATASAICAYAFNLPVVYIETNLRSVFIHCFFPDKATVSDKELLPLVEQTLDRKEPGKWYSALMDYGVMIKSNMTNPGKRSTKYTKQSTFKGSDREIRGMIVKLLTTKPQIPANDIAAEIGKDGARVARLLGQLKAEGFITERDGLLTIA